MRDNLGALVPGTDINITGAIEGPLRKLTFVAKDIFDVAGYVTGCGNPDWRQFTRQRHETRDIGEQHGDLPCFRASIILYRGRSRRKALV